jgi:membrane fusion protein (multidrug efflux system)
MSPARNIRPRITVASDAVLDIDVTDSARNTGEIISASGFRAIRPALHAPLDDAPPSIPAPAQPSARAADAKAPSAETKTSAGMSTRKKALLGSAAAIALVAATWFGYDYITVGRFIVSTDDAYVGADMSIIAPNLSAHVTEVLADANQSVKKGDVLVRLDDGDFRLAVDKAQTKLATQKATITTFAARIAAAEATSAQMRAQLESARATLQRTEADFVRTNTLAQKDYTSRASLDAARAANESAKAQVMASEAAIKTADANVDVLRAQRVEAEHTAKELEVAAAQAERDLSFTEIRAPFDGVVGNKSVQVGDYVTPGKRIAAIVPLDRIYIDANLKETQLARVVSGEPVKVRIDALDGASIAGTVESIAPASGSRFSLLPPENATGNFTKIVQRVPVRIAVRASDAQGKLRPGLSVIVDIDTKNHVKTAVPTTNGTQHAAN